MKPAPKKKNDSLIIGLQTKEVIPRSDQKTVSELLLESFSSEDHTVGDYIKMRTAVPTPVNLRPGLLPRHT